VVEVRVRQEDVPHGCLPVEVGEQAEGSAVDRDGLVHQVRHEELRVGGRDARGEKFDPHGWPRGSLDRPRPA